jgi:hypothetical protein
MAINKTFTNVQGARRILNARSDMAVYQMVQRRQIPFRKLGKRLVFIEEELVEFVNGLDGCSIDSIRLRQEQPLPTSQ